MEYPRVKHKLPELFDLIIQLDREVEVINSSPVIFLKDYIDNKSLRKQYSMSAEKYCQRQRQPDA